MLTLVLTRHGSTPRSDPEQHLGQRLDVPLSDAGRAAAAALGARLADIQFDRVISSPLLRAVQTAELAAPGQETERDPRLMEMDYGRWEGLTYAQIDEVDAAYRRRWEQDPARLPCPGGESGDQVGARVTSFIDEMLDWAEGMDGEAVPSGSDPDRCVLVVGHSSTNRILLCVALGVNLREYRRRFVQASGNLTVLRYDAQHGPGARLLVANDVSHIKGVVGETWG